METNYYKNIKAEYHTEGENVPVRGYNCRLIDATPSMVIAHYEEILRDGGSPSVVFLKSMLAFYGDLASKELSNAAFFDGGEHTKSMADILKDISPYMKNASNDCKSHLYRLITARYSKADIAKHANLIAECTHPFSLHFEEEPEYANVDIVDMAVNAKRLGLNDTEIFDFFFTSVFTNSNFNVKKQEEVKMAIARLKEIWFGQMKFELFEE